MWEHWDIICTKRSKAGNWRNNLSTKLVRRWSGGGTGEGVRGEAGEGVGLVKLGVVGNRIMEEG